MGGGECEECTRCCYYWGQGGRRWWCNACVEGEWSGTAGGRRRRLGGGARRQPNGNGGDHPRTCAGYQTMQNVQHSSWGGCCRLSREIIDGWKCQRRAAACCSATCSAYYATQKCMMCCSDRSAGHGEGRRVGCQQPRPPASSRWRQSRLHAATSDAMNSCNQPKSDRASSPT